MKIDNSHGATPPDAGQTRKPPVRAEQNTAQPGDRVEVSQRPLATAVQDAARAAQIEQLRTQVQNGTYRISADDIARGIVDDMLGGKTV